MCAPGLISLREGFVVALSSICVLTKVGAIDCELRAGVQLRRIRILENR